MRYVALLRGINVGGHKKLSMADLRELVGSLGHSDVTTYIQSGNVVFTSPREDAAALAQEIEHCIERDLGHDVTVLIRTPNELAAVIDGNPFPDATANPSRLHVNFLSAQPDAQRFAEIDASRFAPDVFRLGDRALYLWFPGGAGTTKLTNDFWERRLGVRASARNWNTVLKLLSLANE